MGTLTLRVRGFHVARALFQAPASGLNARASLFQAPKVCQRLGSRVL